ncbi:MAG: hypothetical protein AB7I30_19075, partial [Isosphaeraceae bacterium]
EELNLLQASKESRLPLPVPADQLHQMIEADASAEDAVELPVMPEEATAGPVLDDEELNLLQASKESRLPLPVPADQLHQMIEADATANVESDGLPPLPAAEIDPLKAASEETNIPLPMPVPEIDPLKAASEETNIPLPTSPADLDPLTAASAETNIPPPIAPEDFQRLDEASQDTNIPLPLPASERVSADTFDAALEEESEATRIPLPRRSFEGF